jgi:hypothetical protein
MYLIHPIGRMVGKVRKVKNLKKLGKTSALEMRILKPILKLRRLELSKLKTIASFPLMRSLIFWNLIRMTPPMRRCPTTPRTIAFVQTPTAIASHAKRQRLWPIPRFVLQQRKPQRRHVSHQSPIMLL